MEDYQYLQMFKSTLNQANSRDGIPLKCEPKTDMEVSINVGGKVFSTKVSSLNSVPGSVLSQLDNTSQHFDAETQQYSFDRDPDMFKEILEAHRTGELHAPRNICQIKFKKELQFWKIPISMLMPCCWKYFYDCDTDLETLDKILQCRSQPCSLKTVDISPVDVSQIKNNMAKHVYDKPHSEMPSSSMYKIWLLLEEPTSSTAAKIWCFFYIFMVILSVLIFFLWTETDLRVEAYLEKREPTQQEIQTILQFNERIIKMMTMDPHPVIFVLDCMCIAFFVIESIVLLIVCPNRKALLKSPSYLMKVFVCLAMLSGFLFDIRRDLVTDYRVGKFYGTLKGFSVLRLLFIFKIKKLYTRLQVVLLSLENGAKDLLLLAFVFIMTIVINGGMIYCFEIDTNAFPTTRTAFWWALITMTTIGYGDFYPTSQEGHIAAAFCAVQGLIVIALPIAAIASTFSTFYSRWSDLDTHVKSIKSEQETNTNTDVDHNEHLNGNCSEIQLKE